MEKYCKRCDSTKPLSEFDRNKSRKDGVQGSCKDCCRQRSRDHYHANKQAYIDRANSQRERLRLEIQELKCAPCTDCQVEYPYYVMHFDHVRGEKEFNLSQGGTWLSRSKVLNEIAKCELVCANCHAERTAFRAGYSIPS